MLSREEQTKKKATLLSLSRKLRPSTTKQRCGPILRNLRKLLAPEKPKRLSQILLKKYANNKGTIRTRGQHLVLIVGDGRWLECEKDLRGQIPFPIMTVDPCFQRPFDPSRTDELNRDKNAIGEPVIRLGARMEDVDLRDHVAEPTKVRYVHVLLPRAHVLLQDFEGHIKAAFPSLCRIYAYIESCCGYNSKLEGAMETNLRMCGYTVKLLQKSY